MCRHRFTRLAPRRRAFGPAERNLRGAKRPADATRRAKSQLTPPARAKRPRDPGRPPVARDFVPLPLALTGRRTDQPRDKVAVEPPTRSRSSGFAASSSRPRPSKRDLTRAKQDRRDPAGPSRPDGQRGPRRADACKRPRLQRGHRRHDHQRRSPARSPSAKFGRRLSVPDRTVGRVTELADPESQAGEPAHQTARRPLGQPRTAAGGHLSRHPAPAAPVGAPAPHRRHRHDGHRLRRHARAGDDPGRHRLGRRRADPPPRHRRHLAAGRPGPAVRRRRGGAVLHPPLRHGAVRAGHRDRHAPRPVRAPAAAAGVLPRPVAVGPAAVAAHHRPVHHPSLRRLRLRLPHRQLRHHRRGRWPCCCTSTCCSGCSCWWR